MPNSEVFAVISTGGKQYRVKVGDIIKVEKLADPSAAGAAAAAGKNVKFDNVLMLGDKIGTPTVKGAAVTGEVLEQTRTDKVIIFKKKRRHNYRRTRGHRQHITVVKIKEIKG